MAAIAVALLIASLLAYPAYQLIHPWQPEWRLDKIASRLFDLVLTPLAGLGMLVAIGMVFLYVPSDKVQGVIQRIFYFHVPLAIMTFVAFGVVAIASGLFQIGRAHV